MAEAKTSPPRTLQLQYRFDRLLPNKLAQVFQVLVPVLAIIQKRIFLNIGRPSLRRIAKLEPKVVEIPGRQWVGL